MIHNFLCSKQFELILRLTEYFHGSLIYMFMNSKTLSSLQRLNIFLCNFLQDILSEWDYQLAWHEQEARKTNYYAFDDNRKLKVTKDCIFIYAKSGLKLYILCT